MKITKYAVKNYQLTLVMSIMVAVVGVVTMLTMPRAEDPTPVLTGPLPLTNGPLPSISVRCPTSTPATSVIAFHLPGVPSKGIPKSLALVLSWP